MRTSGRTRKKPRRYADDDDGRVAVWASTSTQTADVCLVDATTTTGSRETGATDSVRVVEASTQTTDVAVIDIREDEGRERERERLEKVAKKLRRELMDALVRETERCAALARSERERARAERDNVKLMLSRD